MPTAPPDRYHNRQEDSPESLRQSIEALTEAVAALDRKLDDSAARVSADVNGARYLTRSLAEDVARMGEVLVSRIDGAGGSKIVAGANRRGVATAFNYVIAAALILALAAALLFGRPRLRERHPTLTPRAAERSVPIAPPPAATQPAVSLAPASPSTKRTVSRRAPHAWQPRHRSSRPANESFVDPPHSGVSHFPDYSSQSHEPAQIQAQPPADGA